MSVTEYERTQLFVWFEEHMGKERAATMMSLLPPIGWGDVATRRDLQLLEDKLTGVEERLGGRMEREAARLDVNVELVAQRLDARIERSQAETQRSLVTWILASQATVVAAAGVLVGVLFAVLY